MVEYFSPQRGWQNPPALCVSVSLNGCFNLPFFLPPCFFFYSATLFLLDFTSEKFRESGEGFFSPGFHPPAKRTGASMCCSNLQVLGATLRLSDLPDSVAVTESAALRVPRCTPAAPAYHLTRNRGKTSRHYSMHKSHDSLVFGNWYTQPQHLHILKLCFILFVTTVASQVFHFSGNWIM